MYRQYKLGNTPEETYRNFVDFGVLGGKGNWEYIHDNGDDLLYKSTASTREEAVEDIFSRLREDVGV